VAERTVEDRLRQEYFELLPEIRRVVEHLEAEVRHCVLPLSLKLDDYERLVVTSRVKECESALDALRRRQEGATFDRDRPELYTLSSLNDLAGVRVLAFPRSRLREIDQQLRERFPSWVPDPVPGPPANDEPLAFKCYGYCEASQTVRGEFQVVSILTGLFWEVEHSAIYKPTPRLKGIAGHYRMRERTLDVYRALQAFEEEFENLIRSDPLGIRKNEEHAP
jgi:hypothetical protein